MHTATPIGGRVRVRVRVSLKADRPSTPMYPCSHTPMHPCTRAPIHAYTVVLTTVSTIIAQFFAVKIWNRRPADIIK